MYLSGKYIQLFAQTSLNGMKNFHLPLLGLSNVKHVWPFFLGPSIGLFGYMIDIQSDTQYNASDIVSFLAEFVRSEGMKAYSVSKETQQPPL